MKKFLTVALVMLIVFCAPLVLGLFSNDSGQYLPEQDTGYTIENYVIDIDVKEDKSMRIKETITVNFSESSHGIVRWLKLRDKVSYYEKNKIVSKNYSNSITNFLNYTSTPCYRFEENGYVFYRFGDDYDTVVGEQTYSFGYTFYSGDDRIKSKDLFYFNIIGTGWDTSIANVNFSVTFPTQVEAQQFDFYVGQYGEDNAGGDSRLTYAISGNKITGNCTNLAYGEAITVYSEFKNGYFNIKRNYLFDIIIAVFTVVIVVWIAIFYYKKKKKDPIVEVVEFEAPKGITPTEAGYLNDGKITGDDLSSLIVYWASNGYVKIKELKKDFEITKIADLPADAKEHEKLFFEAIFRNCDVINSSSLSKLDGALGYRCKQSVEKDLQPCFEKKTENIFSNLCVFVVIVFVLMFWKNLTQACIGFFPALLGFVCVVVLGFGLCFMPGIIKLKQKISKKKFLLYYILDSILVLTALIGFAILMESYSDAFAARFYLMLLPVLCFLIYPGLEFYTKEGRDKLGHIRGLKNYIMMAEKDRMEMLVKDDPTLFYNVLPYAYVLGVSEVYMNKFKDVNIVQPDWYYSEDFTTKYIAYRMVTDLNMISTSITKSMINTNIVNTVSKTTSFIGKIGGGGGRSGGGFSGGGSGGGGGGRW